MLQLSSQFCSCGCVYKNSLEMINIFQDLIFQIVLTGPKDYSLVNCTKRESLQSDIYVILKSLFCIIKHPTSSSLNKYFSTPWNRVKIIPILISSGSPKTMTSYRFMSLLNSLGNILEILILKEINSIFRNNGILNKDQFGFSRGHHPPATK